MPIRRCSAMLSLLLAAGCTAPRLFHDVPDVVRDFKPHLEQVLDNIAAFTDDPGSWPSHVLTYKGTFETRRQWTGAVGSSMKLEENTYAMSRWDLAALEDPYDIRRVRLLYQWQVGHIQFDELERRWNEIRDRPINDAGGKPVLGSDGRPTFLAPALPVAANMRRDWLTSGSGGARRIGALHGRHGLTTVWVTDTEAAAQFALAVLSAMANSRVKARWGDAAMMTP